MTTKFSSDLTMKRGESFLGNFTSTKDGVPDTLPASAFKCEFRDKAGTLLSTGVITAVVGAPGNFNIVVENTTGWPLSYVYFDVRRNDGGLFNYTRTIVIQVIQGQTNG